MNGSTEVEPPGFDPTQPSSARIYDYWLGGKDNFAADREAAEKAVAYAPEIPRLAREGRRFLDRVVRFLAAAGVRQFIDIGTGLPTQGHVHEILRVAAPDARVAYVDHDPVVLAHARALLEGTDRATVIQGDVRDPDGILRDPLLTELIDIGRPVAVLLMAVLHLIGDDDEAQPAVARLREAMAPGSYLAISHAVSDQEERSEAIAKLTKLYQEGPLKADKRRDLRSSKDVLAFFDGLELIHPGVVKVPAWRPEHDLRIEDIESVWVVGGVARKR